MRALVALSCLCAPTRRLSDASARDTDPTGTSGLRARFERDLVRRLQTVRRETTRAVRQQDALGLGRSPDLGRQIQAAMFARMFGGPADKVAAFSRWFSETLARALLGDWQDSYVREAARAGARDAASATGGSAPETSIALLRLRAARDLEGIAHAVELAVSRELTSALTGQTPSPAVLARSLARAIDKVGVVRARVHAAVTIVAAHAEGSLDAYEAAGVTRVGAVIERVPRSRALDAEPPVLGVRLGVRGDPILREHPETVSAGPGLRRLARAGEVMFETKGDERVCPICDDMEGETYTILEARGIIPVHPRCRCRWVPVEES